MNPKKFKSLDKTWIQKVEKFQESCKKLGPKNGEKDWKDLGHEELELKKAEKWNPRKFNLGKFIKLKSGWIWKSWESTSVTKNKVCNYTTMTHISNCARVTSISIKGDYMVEWFTFCK